jgi:hypothetical protein
VRSTTAGLKTAMSATPRTLGWLGKFVFADGTTVRVSGTGQNIEFDDGSGDSPGSQTWTRDKSFKVSQLRDRGNGDVPDGEIVAPAAISDSYDSEDVFVGEFEGMQITLYMIDYTDPSDGSMQRGPYTVSEIDYDDRGKIASFEVRGILQRAKQVTVEELSVSCRSDLGDMRPGYCNLPLYPDDVARGTAYAAAVYVRVPNAGNYGNRMFECTTAGTTDASPVSYDYTVGNPTTDGTAVFTAREAWVRSATIATRTADDDFTLTITESRSVDNWFANSGIVKWITGNNAGFYSTVRAYTHSTKRIRLWAAPPFTVAVADTLEIMPGCDRTFALCLSRFANTINFRGEHLLPGTDVVNGAG